MATQEMINIQSQISKLQEQQKSAPPPMKDVFQQQINTLKSAADTLSKQQASTPKPTTTAPALVYSGGHWVSPTTSTPTPTPAIQIGTSPLLEQINKAVSGPMVASGQISTPTPTQSGVSQSAVSSQTTSPTIPFVGPVYTPPKQSTLPNIIETSLSKTSPFIASQVYQQRTGEVAPFSPTTAITKQQVSAPFIQTIPAKTTQNIANPIIPKTFSDFISEKSNQEMKTMTAPITYSGSPTLLKQVPKSTEWNWGDAFNTTIGAVGNVGKGITDTVGGAVKGIQTFDYGGALKSTGGAITGSASRSLENIKKTLGMKAEEAEVAIRNTPLVGNALGDYLFGAPKKPELIENEHLKIYSKETGLEKALLDESYVVENNEVLADKLLGFDITKPVTLEDGRVVAGKDVVYTVDNFQPQFLHGGITDTNKNLIGTSQKLSADEFATYSHNMGNAIKESIAESDLDYNEMRTKYINYSRDWSPDTKVIEFDPYYYHIDEKNNELIEGKTQGVTTPGGKLFFYDFPYIGANKYYTYLDTYNKNKSNPMTAFSLGTSTENMANIPLALAYATGDKKAQDEIIVKSLGQLSQNYGEQGQMSLGGFFKSWMDSPYTKIGLAYGAGEALGVGGGYATGALGSVASASSIVAGKAALAGIGVAMAYPQIRDIVQTAQSGDVGQALAKTWLLGAESAAAGLGYQHGSSYVTKSGLTWVERGGQRGLNTKISSLEKASVKYGGDTALQVKDLQTGKTIILRNKDNVPLADIFKATGNGDTSKYAWKYLSLSKADASRLKGGVSSLYENIAANRDYTGIIRGFKELDSSAWQNELFAKRGGVEKTFQQILGSEEEGTNLYKFLKNAKSGILKQNKVELTGGQVYKLSTKDIDANISKYRYILDKLQLDEYGLSKGTDVKAYIPKGKIVSTTGFRQPTLYNLGSDFTMSPLTKIGATTGETAFGVVKAGPSGQEVSGAVKNLSTAANVYTRLQQIRTGGTLTGTDTPAGRLTSAFYALEQKPLIQSSSRIKYIYEHQGIADKLFPYVQSAYKKLPTSIKSKVLTVTTGLKPSSFATPSTSIGIPTFSSITPSLSTISTKPSSSIASPFTLTSPSKLSSKISSVSSLSSEVSPSSFASRLPSSATPSSSPISTSFSSSVSPSNVISSSPSSLSPSSSVSPLSSAPSRSSSSGSSSSASSSSSRSPSSPSRSSSSGSSSSGSSSSSSPSSSSPSGSSSSSSLSGSSSSGSSSSSSSAFSSYSSLPRGGPSVGGSGGSYKGKRSDYVGYKEKKHDVQLLGLVTEYPRIRKIAGRVNTRKPLFKPIVTNSQLNVQPYPSMNEYTPSKSTTRPGFFKIA